MSSPRKRGKRFDMDQKLKLKLKVKKKLKIPIKLLRQVGGQRKRKYIKKWIING
jgi:hypothetical protein